MSKLIIGKTVDAVKEVTVYKLDGSKFEQVKVVWADGRKTVFLYNPYFDERIMQRLKDIRSCPSKTRR